MTEVNKVSIILKGQIFSAYSMYMYALNKSETDNDINTEILALLWNQTCFMLRLLVHAGIRIAGNAEFIYICLYFS